MDRIILSDNEIKLYFDSVETGIHIIDSEGVTIYYNKAAEKIDGISDKDIIGYSMREMVNSGIFSCSTGLIALENKQTITRIQNVNGRYVLSTAIPILINDKVEKVITSIREVEQLEELKRQIKILDQINKELSEKLMMAEPGFLGSEKLLYNSKSMQRVMYLAERMAAVDSNVLIAGESGTGKGVVAKYIHEKSTRRDGPFIKVDCSSIPENLFESELFGYKSGAFTGASAKGKEGLVALADKGTLFLDEIGELPLSVQAKLLRFVQDHEFIPVGSTVCSKVDVRIISATNWDLQTMVEKKLFREDLYYRLRVVPINIPPLRDRKDDIIPLIKLFLTRFNKYYDLEVSATPQAMNALLRKPWHGNVRELENEIERLVVTCEDSIITERDVVGMSDIFIETDKESTSESMKDLVSGYEKSLLYDYRRRSKSVKEMSYRAKMNESTLRKKAERYGIDLYFGKNSTK